MKNSHSRNLVFSFFIILINSSVYSQTAMDFFNQGNQKVLNNENDAAILCFNKAIEMYPAFEDAYYNRAIVNYNIGKSEGDYKTAYKNFNQAYYDLTEVIKINPSNANAYFKRGQTNYFFNDLVGAYDDYSKAIKLMPEFENALYNRGYINMEWESYEDATNDFSMIIQIGKSLKAKAYFLRGSAKMELGKENDAISDYDSALLFNKNNKDLAINVLYNRGFAKFTLQDYSEAILDFSKVIELDEKIGEAWSARGVVKIFLGQKGNGCADLTIAKELGYSEADDAIKKFCTGETN